MKRLILASNNAHKVREIKAILSDYDVCTMSDVGIDIDIVEDGLTFMDNAYIKAKAVHDITGSATIADDSGLVVNALGGAPGVYSARFAGEHGNDAKNNQKLLDMLAGITDRTAAFVCAVAMIDEDGSEMGCIGETQGHILLRAEGSNGFGYDPLFYSDELGKSYGLATDAEKNRVSHRKKALDSLVKLLNEKNIKKHAKSIQNN